MFAMLCLVLLSEGRRGMILEVLKEPDQSHRRARVAPHLAK